MSAREKTDPFLCLRIVADDPLRGECALAEAFAAGAAGVEELLEAGRVTFAVYAPIACADRVREALEIPGIELLDVSPLPARDWSEAWKRDLGPIAISPRLLIRPSFDPTEALPGQCLLQIDPAQAFGTGAHESTRLALELIDAIAGELDRDSLLLDVGTGTGVLALAALGLGCGRAVAFDLDRLAGDAARGNARDNGLDEGLRVFVGGMEALAPSARVDGVVANLLLSELRPLLPAIAEHARSGSRVVLSGLIEEQAPEVESACRRLGLEVERRSRRRDASGATWIALLMRRVPADSSR